MKLWWHRKNGGRRLPVVTESLASFYSALSGFTVPRSSSQKWVGGTAPIGAGGRAREAIHKFRPGETAIARYIAAMFGYQIEPSVRSQNAGAIVATKDHP